MQSRDLTLFQNPSSLEEFIRAFSGRTKDINSPQCLIDRPSDQARGHGLPRSAQGVASLGLARNKNAKGPCLHQDG